MLTLSRTKRQLVVVMHQITFLPQHQGWGVRSVAHGCTLHLQQW